MTSEKPRPSESQWLEHKTFIRQEYLVKDTSLKHLMDALASRGLHATKAQLEYKLKKWQFCKNLDRQSWQYIERKINTRKSQGKESEVIHYGRRLDRLKVAKEMRRHSETNIFKQLAARMSTLASITFLESHISIETDAPSPANSQLIVCTPPSYETSMEWPESLPWLRFLNRHWNSAQLLFQPSTLTIAQAQHFGLLLNILDRPGSFSIIGASNGTSKLESLLSNTIPESYPGELSRTAHSLISGPIDDSVLNLFKILVYRISNGTRLVYGDEWEKISTILRSSLRGLPQNLKTLPTDSVVFQAFLDSTFQHEIYHRTCRNPNAAFWPLDLIRWILELGQDPNCPMDQCFGLYCTPIGKAIEVGDLELAQLLLHFHARCDDSQAKSDKGTIIDIALQSSMSDAIKVRTLEFLLQHDNGTDVEEMLSAAISLRDMDLAQTILYQDVDVTKQVVQTQRYSSYRKFDLEHYLDFKSPLTTAAIAGDDFLTLMLDYLEYSDQLTNSVTVDLLIAAAFGRSVEIMRRLLNIRPLSTASNAKGSTPLQAAVAGGNIPVCQMLLEIDQRLPPGLVYLAASFGHENVLLMLRPFALHGLGRHLNQSFVGLMSNRCCSSCVLDRIIVERFKALHESAVNCLTILIEQGARMEKGKIAKLACHWLEEPLKAALASGGNPNDQDDQGLTALQCALMRQEGPASEIDKGPLIVEILLQAKARLTGGEVVAAIQNENEACISLLCDYGATLGDCDSTGKTCLEAAIFAQNTELIQDILEKLDPSIDLRPVCAALQMENRALAEQLLLRLGLKEECPSMQATAIGLAAASGYFDIFDELESRFFPFDRLALKALLPYTSTRYGDLWAMERTDPNYDDISDEYLQNLVIEYPCKTCRFTPCVKASPLALVACGGNVSGFQKLLEKGYRACTLTMTILAKLKMDEIVPEFVELLKIYQPRLEHLLPFPGIRNPLTTAIINDNITLFKYLVEGGMDVNANDKALILGWSPLQTAVWKENLDVVHYLLGKGAAVNGPPNLQDGRTALQAAVMGRHIGLANILIERGARINARGARIDGHTALEWAADTGHIDMLQLLLHHGAITTGPGRRQFVIAVGIAMKFAHNGAVKFLKRECGWTEADEGLLQQYRDPERTRWYGYESYDWGEGCVVCRTYCCDEIHNSDASCIHDYSAKEEESFADVCRVCNELDDSSESDHEAFTEATSCRHQAVNEQTERSEF
ncbi:hypothetical protein ACHAP5_006464 [Fusarium lateritium]